jgi:hypothetical protein
MARAACCRPRRRLPAGSGGQLPARLGWSHGDAEVFSVAAFVEWFDLGG